MFVPKCRFRLFSQSQKYFHASQIVYFVYKTEIWKENLTRLVVKPKFVFCKLNLAIAI